MQKKFPTLILLLLLLVPAAEARYRSRDFLRSDVALQSALLDHAKKTVCTITINSDNERRLFEKYLDPKDFQFIELTPEKNASKAEDDSDDKFGDDAWFDQACKSDVKCDVLVISGHFGGKFVGDKGFSLDLGTIESHACARDCAGITSNPTEAFLFGCNTLAGKKKDSRTVEEYFQVLVKDGWNPTDAQAVAEARYGALAQDNRERMRMAFRGVKNIYGFDSIAPSGKTVDPLLESYLRSVGDYREHLERMAKIEVTSEDQILNPLLERALKPTALSQCTSSKDSPTNCGLFDPSYTRLQQTEFAEGLLRKSDRLKYVSAIVEFFETKYVYYEAKPSAEEQAVIDRMKANVTAKNEIARTRSLLQAPSAIVTLLRLQTRMEWLTEAEIESAHAKIANALFKLPMSLLSKDTLCGIYANEGPFGDGSYLEDNDDFRIQPAALNDLNALEALRCMDLGDDERFEKAALAALGSKVLGDRQLYLILDTAKDLGHSFSSMGPEKHIAYVDRILAMLKKQAAKPRVGETKEALESTTAELLRIRSGSVKYLEKKKGKSG
ncbi:MAG: hypothetical protein JST04_12010 [Bdellovibrionales bacterium]|nr:hypothetical protein [Bdellovibrionales bacterium]